MKTSPNHPGFAFALCTSLKKSTASDLSGSVQQVMLQDLLVPGNPLHCSHRSFPLPSVFLHHFLPP